MAAWDDAQDLKFANAVFHWMPDHATLFPALIDRLRPGGPFPRLFIVARR